VKQIENLYNNMESMKKIISLLLVTTFLASCSGSDQILWESQDTKTDFFVETTLGSEFASASSLEKVWKVSSSQDISLTANTNGRVSSVFVKVGDSVQAWQILARLEDTIWNLWINLQRSNIAIDRARINYESSEISLDKQIFDARQQLETLKRNLSAARLDAQQNLLQAQDTLSSSDVANQDSQSALRLQQIDNNIEKSELDFEIKVTADAQQITSYSASLRRDFNSLTTYLDDIIDFSDNILWVTDINRNENRRFEQFLWALDTQQKSKSKNVLKQLIALRASNDFQNKDTLLRAGNLSEIEILETIEYINDIYEVTDDLLMALEQTLFNSTPSVGELSEQEIDWYLAQINWFQSQSQATYGAFISFGSGVKTFLETYRDSQASILKSIELQKKDRELQAKTLWSSELSAQTWLERTRISIEDTISNLQAQIVSAENSLANAIKNKDVTLRSLENAISEANVWYAGSANEFDKLIIRSPINGTISQSFIDVWQEVFSGNSVFDIVSDSTPEVQVSFSAGERDLVSLGQDVTVEFSGKEISWTVYSISEVADENLNYKSTIVFDSGTNIIWNIVSVTIPVSTWQVLLPINIIETQWDNIGRVQVLSWTTLDSVRIRTWEVYWEYIELVSCAQQCEELKIITNDISNYDENKFNIVEK